MHDIDERIAFCKGCVQERDKHQMTLKAFQKSIELSEMLLQEIKTLDNKLARYE
jgi:hypothetical protein